MEIHRQIGLRGVILNEKKKTKGVGLMDCKYCGKQIENGQEDLWYERTSLTNRRVHGGGVVGIRTEHFCGECSLILSWMSKCKVNFRG